MKLLLCDVCKSQHNLSKNGSKNKIIVTEGKELDILNARDSYIPDGEGGSISKHILDICNDCIRTICYTGKYLKVINNINAVESKTNYQYILPIKDDK